MKECGVQIDEVREREKERAQGDLFVSTVVE
jgi:hypothetical protein